MARNIIADLLQNHRFWLFDVVPSATYPFFVLGSPMYGFQAISMPEYTFEAREIKQVNSMLKRTVYEGGGWGTVTLSRGVRMWDDTFYEWVRRAIDGLDTIDRHLMLVQFAPGSADSLKQSSLHMADLIRSMGGADSLGNSKLIAVNMEFGAMDCGYMRNLPGRALLMWNCVPTRYKPGSDLDATDAGVSIMELDIAPMSVVQFDLLAPV